LFFFLLTIQVLALSETDVKLIEEWEGWRHAALLLHHGAHKKVMSVVLEGKT
jgi:hypothetical protein